MSHVFRMSEKKKRVMTLEGSLHRVWGTRVCVLDAGCSVVSQSRRVLSGPSYTATMCKKLAATHLVLRTLVGLIPPPYI